MSDRRFNSSQRQALYLASGGRCSRCGKELGEDWEADHIEPYSADGVTDVVNGQALCARCNREKAATTGHRLRAWQERAFDAYVAKSAQDFLVVATPGAGKTRLAGEIVRNHLLASEVARILVVVPTERLKFQWADDLARLGVELDPRWENAHGVLPSEMNGVVLTYQQVQSNPDLLRKHTSARRTFVVLDEIHHCGNNKSWGDALRQAFDPAIRRLSLSGTPFRTDNYEIPYVTYHDGVGQADFNYGYAEALLDGVCRPVYFPRRGGLMEWSPVVGVELKHTFDDELPEREANDRLRTALRVGDWLPDTIRDANEKLQEMRSEDEDAAAFVLAIDESHARDIAQIVRRVTDHSPVVVTSQEVGAVAQIDRFTRSKDPWLVSIRMVSEGVDIPRLRVGVYATTTTTELFFRQAVGRLVRVEDDGPDAHMFIPDDRRLRDWAEQIKNERSHAIEEEEERWEREKREPGQLPLSQFLPLSSTSTDEGVITHDGETFRPDQLAAINNIKTRNPDTAKMDSVVFAIFLRNAGVTLPGARPPRTDPVGESQPLYQRKKVLKDRVNRLVKKFGYSAGIPYHHLNSALNQAVGAQSRSEVTPEQLEKMVDLVRAWAEGGRIPDGR